MILYFFYSAFTTDGQNLFPDAFAALNGWDSTTLLAYATPAGIIGLIGGFVFGRLNIKIGSKINSGITLIISGALFAVFGIVPSPMLYFVVMALICFFAAGFGSAACPAFIASWFPRKKGIALGWATMEAPLCTALFVSSFSVLLGKYGVKTSFVIYGVIAIIIGAVTFVWAKNDPADVGALPDNMELDDSMKAEEELRPDDARYSIANILKNKYTWLISIGYGLLWMVTIGVVSQFVPRMMSVGYSNAEALRFMTVSALIAIPGSYFWGWLDAKVGTKRATVVYAASYVIALALLITSFNIALVWIGCVFVGLGIGGLLNLLSSMIITAFGKSGFMSANSIIMPITSVIRMLAFVLMAMMLTISGGSYTLPYLVFIVVDIVGAIVIMLIPQKK
ncbi:MAG: MFS transporter [Clostridiales bacterium]|nr:MFS transporter [Clostridiales bacterium]